MPAREDVLQQVLALPPADRAFVARGIEDSLAQAEFATPEIARAWLEEVERRASAYDRGEIAADEWRVVVARLRAQLTPASPS